MLRRSWIQAAALASAGLCAPYAAQAVAVLDQPAPLFTGKGADGRPIDLAAYRGKTVVLEWTNHDCPFVKRSAASTRPARPRTCS
jgi:hypothetical protein